MQRGEFPFLVSLTSFSDKLSRWCNKEYSYYLTKPDEFEDELLDTKEDLLDPIKRFMNGEQAKIYSDIKNLLAGDTSNLDYVEGNEINVLHSIIDADKPYTGNKIKDAKASKDALSKKVQDKISSEKTEAVQSIEKAIVDLMAKDDFSELEELQQRTIVKPLEDELEKLQKTKYIARIRDIKRRATDDIFTKQLNAMVALANLVEQPNDGASVVAEPKVHYIKRSNVKPPFSKSELKTEEEVDEYVEALKLALKEHIRNNRRIQL